MVPMTAVQPAAEILFVAEESPDGGFVARAVGVSIFTEAATLDALRANVREAVACHYESHSRPSVIRLRIIREEVLPTDG